MGDEGVHARVMYLVTGAEGELVTQMMSREGTRQKSPKRQWRTDFGEAQLAIQLGEDRLIELYGDAGGGQILRRPHNDLTVTHNTHSGIDQKGRHGARGREHVLLRARHGGVIPPGC